MENMLGTQTIEKIADINTMAGPPPPLSKKFVVID